MNATILTTFASVLILVTSCRSQNVGKNASTIKQEPISVNFENNGIYDTGSVDGDHAFGWILAANKTLPAHYFVLGTDEESQLVKETVENSASESLDSLIALAESQNGEKLLKDMYASQMEELLGYNTDFDTTSLVGKWHGKGSPERCSFMTNLDHDSWEPLKIVKLGSVKTDQAWKVPVILKYGGWNSCPNPDAQGAIWKYWQTKYGAEIVGITSSIIEAYVPNPPKTRDEAMALAREQFAYCSDNVLQGSETIAVLAESLINNHSWYFWWD